MLNHIFLFSLEPLFSHSLCKYLLFYFILYRTLVVYLIYLESLHLFSLRLLFRMNDNDSAQKTITLKAPTNNAYKPYEVSELKQKLDAWKVLLLPINNLLEWEHTFDPFVIVAANTFLFGMLMYYSPSILTTIAVLGLTMLLVESVVPLITGYFFKRAEWDPSSDMKYTRICERLSNFHRHFIAFRVKLENIRRERQSLVCKSNHS